MTKLTLTLFENARLALESNQITKAIHILEQIILLEPHHTEALHALGIVHAQHNHVQQAMDYLKTALELQPENVHIHTNLGSVYKKSHQFLKAIEHYQAALNLAPDHALAHNNLATLYVLQNESAKALQHYYLAVQAAPDYLDAHYNLGLFFLNRHELGAAKKEFYNVLSLNPSHVQAHYYLGLLALKENDLEDAEQYFLQTLNFNTEHIEALVNLGVVSLKRAQTFSLQDDANQNLGQQSIYYFTQALALDKHHLEARNNLAATFMHYDRFENALTYYYELLEEDPVNLEYLYNSGVAEMALGHLSKAREHFDLLLTKHGSHHSALINLAAIHMRLGDRNQAIQLLKEALTIHPQDACNRFLLQALTGKQSTPETCSEYARLLFNNYALYYEKHLKQTLEYKLPEQMDHALHHLNFSPCIRALDLGCGTGLSGMVMHEWCDELIGVDIAEKMLVQARSKNIYDQLINAEISIFLSQNEDQFGLIVALDVIPYFGELMNLFAAISTHLCPDGIFIFNCETNSGDKWMLQESVRFSHHPSYIKEIVAITGLELIYQKESSGRLQETQIVPMVIYGARKSKLAHH